MECITYSNKTRSLKSQYGQRREDREKTPGTVRKSTTAGASLKLDMKRYVVILTHTGFDNI